MHHTFGLVGHSLGRFSFTRWLIRKWLAYDNVRLEQDVFGKKFTNPVGLAAGFDKDLQLCHTISDVGFGFTEVGSITAKPYAGNTKPRLHRLKHSQGLIVYYGLKNKGVEYALQKLRSYKHIAVPVIVSVAKTNCSETTSIEGGIADYIYSLEAIKALGDDVIVELNISCPNSFGGEDFADTERFEQLLKAVDQVGLSSTMLVKMPLEKPWDEMQTLLDLCMQYGIAGVVIANLLKNRDDLSEKEEIATLPGGISGKPMYNKSNELIGKIYQYCGQNMKIIGVGGVFSAEDAYEKIQCGATLVELITGMIYEGPQRIGQINAGLVKLLDRDGYETISDAIGSRWKDTESHI